MNSLRTESYVGGQAMRQVRDALAKLRVEVFRAFPYLYEGSFDYELEYLEVYFRCDGAFSALVWDGTSAVGATTMLPLSDAEEDVRKPFTDAGYDVAKLAYFGESVLLEPYRGRGLGVKFFELREAHARRLGLGACTFCAVDRPADHPARPADYVPNDRFWERRGYRKMPELQATFSWPDIGETESTPKTMSFWMREL
ncbi:MAG: GNAT family N-acetyltransferase [Myxococcales bacterium]|nr:GNAT family N-acetyltransferase [Myxococcales bacterium]